MEADIPGVLLGYAEEAAGRLRAWATWHIDRGERRGVSQASISTLWSVAAAVDDLTCQIGQGADSAALTECASAILEAIDDAGEIADRHRSGRESHNHDQAVEVESGRVRQIGRVVISILDFREMLIAGDISKTEALVTSAQWMIHEAPAPQVTK